jgi:beta-glucosidase
MVDSFVRGSQQPIPWVQNSTLMTLAACVKHWIGYSMPNGGTDREDAKISPWLMERFFVPPFRAAVAAGSISMMLNSGSVNGLPSTSNKYHIDVLLRTRLGWGDGMMMTDWQGASYIVGRGWGKNVPEVTRQIVEAGYAWPQF